MTQLTLTTANTPGAVAILQLQGEGVADTLVTLTGRQDWPVCRALLCDFAGIDEGLAVLIHDDTAQLMPHGGPRVVQKLIEHLTSDHGCTYQASPNPQSLYPEASSPIEADMLDAIARAASPAAIDLLAAQPKLWTQLVELISQEDAQRSTIAERSGILDRLITPPTVVLVGPPNVGKSTLTNALMGKSVSIVADLPGTTRDWIGGLVEIRATNSMQDAVAVHWLDTPGLHGSEDAIEQRAIALAKQQIERADVLIAMRDAEQDWPSDTDLVRKADVWVINKVDDAAIPSDKAGTNPDLPIHISAKTGRNLDRLQSRVIERLDLVELRAEPWAFSQTLRAWCEGKTDLPVDYLG